MPKNPHPERAVSYVDKPLLDWVGRKATSLGLTVSAYIRMVLMGERAKDDV